MDTQKNNILYIDDDEVNLILFEASFANQYKVFTASNTKIAEQLMETNQFKVVISDISMPGETGLDFIKRYKAPNFEPIFILLTAYINNDLLLKAINQGRIFRYLTKPFVIDEVRLTISQAIEMFDLRLNNQILYQQTLQSQQNFYNIFQASKDGIVIFSPDYKILEANAAFLLNFNNETLSVTGADLFSYIPQNLKESMYSIVNQVAEKRSGRMEIEVKFSECLVKYFEIQGSYIEFKGDLAIFSIFRDFTEQKQNEKKILNAIVYAEEKERSRLAKDLHDGLGPILATLKMYLEWLNDQKKISEHPDILKMALTSTEEAIINIKSISNNLSPHVLEKFGIAPALNSYLDKIRKVSSVNFEVNIQCNERLPLTSEMSVYRIITECITNSLRHSKASEISISLLKKESTLEYHFRDNGKGFSLNDISKHKSGNGLANMQNRIKILGGNIEIKSEPGSGVLVFFEIPIN